MRRWRRRSARATRTNFPKSSLSPSCMASNPISAGLPPKPRSAERTHSRVRAGVLAAAALFALGAEIGRADDPKLLPNERAFAFSARGVDERTVEARFVIADGY